MRQDNKIVLKIIKIVQYLFMFIQNDKMPGTERIYVKGSGTSGCLLTGKLDDEIEFIELKIKNIQIIDIQLSGLFVISLGRAENHAEKEKEKESKVLRWGSFDNQIIIQPQIIQIKTQITQITCGWNHALFKTNQGHLLGTGENKYGQLGLHNSAKFHHTLLSLIQHQYVDAFSAGFRQSYWSTRQNEFFGCGQSKNNELGVVNKKERMPGIKIEYQKNSEAKCENKRIRKIVCGKKYAVLLNQANQVYAVGSNDYECLISNKNINYLQRLTKIKKDITDIESGWSHVVYLDNNGRIFTKGRNNFGQLGRQPNQQFVQIGEKCVSIKSGTQFTFALGQSGSLYGWGWNEHLNITNENQSQSQKILRPKLIEKPKNLRIQGCITYPAVTIIKGVQIQY